MDEVHDSLFSFTPHPYELTNQKLFGKQVHNTCIKIKFKTNKNYFHQYNKP